MFALPLVFKSSLSARVLIQSSCWRYLIVCVFLCPFLRCQTIRSWAARFSSFFTARSHGPSRLHSVFVAMCTLPCLLSAKATRFLVKSCDSRPRITIVIVRRVFSTFGRWSHSTYGTASKLGFVFFVVVLRCSSFLSSFMIPLC